MDVPPDLWLPRTRSRVEPLKSREDRAMANTDVLQALMDLPPDTPISITPNVGPFTIGQLRRVRTMATEDQSTTGVGVGKPVRLVAPRESGAS